MSLVRQITYLYVIGIIHTASWLVPLSHLQVLAIEFSTLMFLKNGKQVDILISKNQILQRYNHYS